MDFEKLDKVSSYLSLNAWIHIPLMFINELGDDVLRKNCRNSNSIDCTNDRALGEEDTRILMMGLVEGMMDMNVILSL